MRPRVSYWNRAATALAWKPEWPVGVLAALAWVALLLGRGTVPDHSFVHASISTRSWDAFAPTGTGIWALMCVAMMVPATLPAVRHVAVNSIQTRRHRAMGVYVTAYLTVWMVFGLAAAVVSSVARAGASESQLLVFTLAVATAWQFTPIKRRAVIACRRTVPLPPDGWRADTACARFGLRQAWRCLASCWPLMLLMTAGEHSVILMIVLTLIVLAEERLWMRGRLIQPFAVAFATATLVTFLAL